MADHSLIDTCLDDLRASLRWHRNSVDIVAEAEDHLHSTVETLIAGGVDDDEAQRQALTRFGDPSIVARAYAVTGRGRLALPTRSSNNAGVVGVVSGAMWLATPAVTLLGWWLYDRVGDTNEGDHLGNPAQLALVVLIGATLIGAAGTLFATALAMNERHGGFGVPGMLGIGATGLGVLASLIGWFFVGWGSLLVVATALLAIDLWRQGLAPRASVLALGCGLSLGALCWGVLRWQQVGRPDRYGDYQIANTVGLVAGPVILGVGLIGLGRWLGNEEPIDLGPNRSDGGSSVPSEDIALRPETFSSPR